MNINIKNSKLLDSTALGFYLGGSWQQESASKKTFSVENPANGEKLYNLPNCGKTETISAIEQAYLAFNTWKETTAKERAALLMKWSTLIKANQADLALIMTSEQGKPLAEAMGEVLYAASFVDWFAEEGKRVYGDIIPPSNKDQRILVMKQPVGVCGIITPWNFPLAMITRKLAPALAAGCTAVIKPSEITPLCAIALIRLAEEAGLPPGVINLVFGDAPEIGDTLCASQLVRKISFTGSTRVGKLLMEKSSSTIKKLSLELGGNAPFIVFDDADLEIAVKATMICKFRNTGQTCVCANRIYVQSGIYNKYLDRLTEEVKKLKVGIGTEEGVTQGPLINKAAKEKVHTHLQDALQKGAQLVLGSDGNERDDNSPFFTPTILKKVPHNALMCQEETFGPLAGISVFETVEEVIEKANDSEYGLAAYFCTSNLMRAWKVAEALESGIVGINEGIISSESTPFGGIKQSGLGREGSKYGIDEYLEIKYVLMGIAES